MFGTPLTISSDQGTQFESALFTALSNLIKAQRTRTTPYYPQANGMVERFHRTLKAALMCNPHIPWPDGLPTVLLGLRTAFKDDEFFVTSSNPASAPGFVSKLRQLMASMKAVPAARHTHQKPFFHRDLRSCSHVFKRVDTIRRSLDPPYSGPHEVVRRIDDRTYVIVINGVERTFSTDAFTSTTASPHRPSHSAVSIGAPRTNAVFSPSSGKPTGGRDPHTIVSRRRCHWRGSGCGASTACPAESSTCEEKKAGPAHAPAFLKRLPASAIGDDKLPAQNQRGHGFFPPKRTQGR